MMKKMLMVLMLAASAATVVPAPVSAQDCTRGYMKCLNDSHDMPKVFQILADVECFSDYLKCVAF